MMGHRTILKGGDEWDMLTAAKRFFKTRPGVRRLLKRKHNKRVRKASEGWGGLT